MTILWEPTKNQTQCGLDKTGNYFLINHALKTITVRTPDGYIGCSWTIKEALDAATSKREEALKSYLPQPAFLFAPANLEADDLNYWTACANTLLDQPCKIICGWF